MTRIIGAICECKHSLGSHPPDPAHPFAWPCRECDCMLYRERTGIKEGESVEYYAADIDPEQFVPGPDTVTATVINAEWDTETREEPIQWLTLSNGDVIRSDYLQSPTTEETL